jgi:carbonic anhydrase
MHTVHAAKENVGNVQYAAMGIMFSVNDANIELNEADQKVIDDFFNSLKWDQTSSNPKVAEVPYGNLMMMVNTRDRWVYKGSVTTPPCATYVYWNVLTTIYPIKAEVLDNFKK